MAAIYDYETGEQITVGLQGCTVSDQAIQAARRIAAQRDEPVTLEDDDGTWIVYPDGACVEDAEQRMTEDAMVIEDIDGSWGVVVFVGRRQACREWVTAATPSSSGLVTSGTPYRVATRDAAIGDRIYLGR